MLGRHPRWNSTHRDRMSPLCGYESRFSVLPESFLFRERLHPLFSPAFFRDEWAYAGSDPAFLTLSPERGWSRLLLPCRSASLCGRERHSLVRGKWRWDPSDADSDVLSGSIDNPALPRSGEYSEPKPGTDANLFHVLSKAVDKLGLEWSPP